MKKIFTLLFCVLIRTFFGQVDTTKKYNNADYSSTKYSVLIDTFEFNNFKIELIQAKLRDIKMYNATSSFCRIWLTVSKGNAVIDKLFINDCEAVGGCSGIYVSKEQTRKDYFILSKFGDYDGRILIIDTFGKIKSFIGGEYYLSIDNNVLFSTYNSDLSGFTIYDFSKNQVIFSSDTIQYSMDDFYYFDNKYFTIISDDVKKINHTDILIFDFKTNKLIHSSIEDKYIEKATRLKGFNIFTFTPCDCGQTKQ